MALSGRDDQVHGRLIIGPKQTLSGGWIRQMTGYGTGVGEVR
jgi:hypothetical protein